MTPRRAVYVVHGSAWLDCRTTAIVAYENRELAARVARTAKNQGWRVRLFTFFRPVPHA